MIIYPALIPDDAFDTTIPPDEFKQTFADIVGNAGDDSDGFETLFAEAASVVDDAANLLSAMDTDLGNAGTVAGETNDAWEQDFSDTLGETINSGESDFKQFGLDLTNNSPPSSSGGGNGGGNGGGTTPTCDATVAFPDPQGTSYPFERIIYLQNLTNGDIQVESVKLFQDISGVWTLTTQCGGILQAGTTCALEITQQVPAVDGTQGRIEAQTTTQATPYVLCLQVGGTDSGLGSGGNGGNGGGGGGGGGRGEGGGGAPAPIDNPPTDESVLALAQTVKQGIKFKM